MHKLTRTSLAAIVCPSAPFLAPRLLRTTVPTAIDAIQCVPSTLQKSCYATKTQKREPVKKLRIIRSGSMRHVAREYKKTQDNEVTSLLKQLRQACDTRNVHQMMDIYPNLRDLKALSRHDTRQIAQALHTRTRHNTKASDLFPFIQQFVTDVRSGALEPHPYAYVHLLGIYKDCKRFEEGHELWQWLVQQDERHVSQAAYGAAIELMAYGGLSTLPELEDLYADGLKRFPGTFAEYHLSPDAIVPDRSQPTLTLGVPTLLLQGMCTARLLSRDWKRAYLALDTILRLYPTQTPPRFFELFMIERPITEAYTAFTIACRAGIVLNPGQVTALLTKMKAAMQATSSLSDRVMILRATANALYAYQEAGGQLESLHIGVFVHCFEQLLPELAPGEDYHETRAAHRNIIVIAVHEILAGLLQAGLSAQIHPFEALMSLAGKLRVPNLLTTTLGDISAVKMNLGPIGTRSALTSAGLVKNKPLIEQLWTGVVAAADAEGSQIAFEDWITFTKACRRAGHAEYFHQQLSKLSHTNTSRVENHLKQQMTFDERVAPQEFTEGMTPAELTTEMEGLKEQMKNIEAVLMSGSSLDLQMSPFHMHLDPATTSLSSLELLRRVYDELTTDPHQPPPTPLVEGSQVKPVVSSTGIPLDQLRFMNWLSVLEMMDGAEEYESRFQFAMNQAIDAGKPFKETLVDRLRRSKRGTMGSRDSLRDRIRTLRNPNAIDLPVFRKVSTQVPEEKFKAMRYDPEDDQWKRAKITKHRATDLKIQKIGQPPQEPKETRKARPQIVERKKTAPVEDSLAEDDVERYGKNPTLRYYVGLESHHEAPNLPKQSATQQREEYPAHEDESNGHLPSDSPPVEQITIEKGS
ncbi:hypothetical protein CC86DRAFT_358851 [Ophiobolus disseminans]|uniref:Uncharacterized protein n=1 Tax=Ophiobolus disseminans TaxID=1469910 RepID=A0A6A6ZLJ0_9PLEO|nr:hypothetical protein CC86DRAFT_358851 [Ophiobolus disseminans]